MQTYKQVYTRENCLIAVQVWEEHQIHLLKQKLGESAPLTIFDVYGGVIKVYYHEDIWDVWGNIIANKVNSEPDFAPTEMKALGERIDQLEKIWHRGEVDTAEDIVKLFDLAAWTWVGVSISYCLPDIKSVSKEAQDLGMKLRNRTLDFLEFTDNAIKKTLRKLYPELGDLIKYISIEELKENDIPSKEILKDREQHYIYYDFKLYTGRDVYEFAKEQGIEIKEEEVPTEIKELKGQTAMGGKVTGPVRILHKKSEIPDLQDGEILVTHMTTPDYLPAMNKAIAFVTDEGGITCHAAIVAREMGKPCVIGTKIASKALKTGDIIEIDADAGLIKIL
ncbi:MAG: PEP-utilizing enzyme [Candidatus Paceibacterota bacterium]|jgi:phosphohistidine swiveling domain-containing protein